MYPGIISQKSIKIPSKTNFTPFSLSLQTQNTPRTNIHPTQRPQRRVPNFISHGQVVIPPLEAPKPVTAYRKSVNAPGHNQNQAPLLPLTSLWKFMCPRRRRRQASHAILQASMGLRQQQQQ